jgi:hypothetical protein
MRCGAPPSAIGRRSSCPRPRSPLPGPSPWPEQPPWWSPTSSAVRERCCSRATPGGRNHPRLAPRSGIVPWLRSSTVRSSKAAPGTARQSTGIGHRTSPCSRSRGRGGAWRTSSPAARTDSSRSVRSSSPERARKCPWTSGPGWHTRYLGGADVATFPTRLSGHAFAARRGHPRGGDHHGRRQLSTR